jgi:DNA-directed RNA polymerase beta subunit
MTENGTFVINGAERVIVSQIVRSPGMYYEGSFDKTGKRIFTSTVIPYRGAWLEYETDANDVFYVRIDKNRKIPVTVLVRALGVQTPDEIRALLGDDVKINATLEKDECERLAVESNTTIQEEALKEIYKRLRPGEPAIVESAQILINNLFFDPKRYDLYPVGRYKFNKKCALGKRIAGHTLARSVINPLTGELLFEEGKHLSFDEAVAVEMSAVNEVYLRLENGAEVKVLDKKPVDAKDHNDAITILLETLTDKENGGVLESMNDIAAVGHRVLHGGEKFSGSVLVDEAVKEAIRECIPLGPLHNPANLTGIEVCESIMPIILSDPSYCRLCAKVYSYKSNVVNTSFYNKKADELDMLIQAKDFISKENYLDAINIYDNLFTITGNYNYQKEIANIHAVCLNNTDKAIALYKDLEKDLQNDAQFWWQFSEMYERKNNHYKQVLCIQKAIKLELKNKEASVC